MYGKIVRGIGLSEDLKYLLENFLIDSKYFFEYIDISHYSPEVVCGDNKPYAIFLEEDSIVTEDVKLVCKVRKVPVIIIGNSKPEGKQEDCVFVLNLPLFSVKLVKFLDFLEAEKRRSTRYITSRKALKGKKFLIFENSKVEAEKFREVLAGEEAIVKVLASTENFEEEIKAFSPDLIILDIIIEPYDGFEVLDSLRNNRKLNDIPVVVTSVKNEIDDQKTSLLLGASEFIPKPIEEEAVKKVVKKVLSAE